MTRYISTRGAAGVRSFEDVLLAGLAEDGGLFVPEAWPRFEDQAFKDLAGLSYPETAARVIHPFVGDGFTFAELLDLCERAYAGFAHPAVAPLRQLDHDEWALELFHGPTLAFKDVALQLLGLMFERVLARRRESITIVGATSGDTGSAAIHAVAGRERMRIVILHPYGRTSAVQRRQMTTVLAPNVVNIAVEGTFDDCQALVKAMFNDAPFRNELRLAAVNSINWVRLVAQSVYYVFAALRLGGLDRPLAFAVPTGNFGDVYAGYIAHQLGLPIRRLIVATNRNDILARFFAEGIYRPGEVHATISPSMDIQVASNFERLLFELEDRDPARLRAHMDRFARERMLQVVFERLAEAKVLFAARHVGEEDTAATIKAVLARSAWLPDPHTAVGLCAGRRAHEDPTTPLVALATAHPAKFPEAVQAAVGTAPDLPLALADLFAREERYTVLPNDLAAIQAFIRRGTSA